MPRVPALFNTLIRTHHITSRKKLARVTKAAAQLQVHFLLIRSGGSPGIMFAESTDAGGLAAWVGTVQALRYKDFRCVRKPAEEESEAEEEEESEAEEEEEGAREQGMTAVRRTGVVETESVKGFGEEMERRGLGRWWRRGMGYEGDG